MSTALHPCTKICTTYTSTVVHPCTEICTTHMALFCTLALKYAQLTRALLCTFAPKYAQLATYFLCTLSNNVLLNRQSLNKLWVQISTKRSAILLLYLPRSKKSPPVRPQSLPSKSLPSHYSLNITRSELLTVSSITCNKTVFWNVTPCRL